MKLEQYVWWIVYQNKRSYCLDIRNSFLLLYICISISSAGYSQQKDSGYLHNVDSSLSELQNFPSKYYAKVDKKISSVNDQLSRKSLKYLAKFQKQEKRLQQKLQKLNPGLAVTNANEKYAALSEKIKSKTAGVSKIAGGEYIPHLDSLATSLSFLKQFNGIGEKVKDPLSSLTELQSKLQQAEKIKEFIAERKSQLKEVLSKYTKLPAGLKNEYTKLSKTAYYYSAQVKEYKDILKDPKKIEQKALGILNKLPAFQNFMKQNGQLASLFRLPDNSSSAQALTGLQTRSSVQSLIQQRIASGGPNAQAQIQQNLAAAHAELNKLKDKINQFGNRGGDADLPNFKPNSQKTKSFFKRLEYSADVQFEKSNNLLPSAANIGLGIGYKANDNATAGIGVSYKMGIGNIQHIAFTSQGIGLRSYLDWKAPFGSPKGGMLGNLFVSAGYEMNYNSAFKNIEQLKNYNAWQRSALIGLSRKYKISKKVKGEIKLLYDFLANTHTPISQPIVFRIGYKF
jgi:hypothetical protein